MEARGGVDVQVAQRLEAGQGEGGRLLPLVGLPRLGRGGGTTGDEPVNRTCI